MEYKYSKFTLDDSDIFVNTPHTSVNNSYSVKAMTDTLMDAPIRAVENQEPANKIRLVSVDCVIFGLADKRLKALIIKHSGGMGQGKWALPGGYIYEHESLEDAASRLLFQLTNVEGLYLEQLQTFSELGRVPGQRTITTAFFSLVQPELHALEAIGSDEAKWFDVEDMPQLTYDHNKIVKAGVERLRRQIQFEPIGVNLLPEKFTLGQLQDLYEAILGEKLDKPNFRRKILRMDFLTKCNETQKKVPHRAGTLYTFDREAYERLCQQGFNFRF